MTVLRVVAFTPIAGPYVVARYSQFASFNSSAHFTLIEIGELSSVYSWKYQDRQVPYKRRVLFPKSKEPRFFGLLAWKIFRELTLIQPDVVVTCGYGVRGMLVVLFWSLLYKKPIVLLSETKEDDFPRIFWREAFKRFILSQYSSALVGGRPHKRYMIKLGMAPEAIFSGYDVVGNEDFHPGKNRVFPAPLEHSYFLAINRFVPKKNLFFLVSAYALYRQKLKSDAWELVICGDGVLRHELEQQIQNLNLQNYIHLPGFLQQNELLPYFAHADCFIHSSIQEQWGLVVNEAMASGLPVLVSNRCGCFEDLVLEGINGFGFDPENVEELANLMVKMSSGNVNLEAMGKASLEHIQNFSPEHFAKGLMQAVEYAIAHP